MKTRAIELSHIRKASKIKIVSALLGITIIALIGSIFVGSSASANRQAGLEQSSGARLAAVNNTPNPGIDVDCEKPVLTIAISIDRSGSAFGDRNTYINTVKTFIDDLYNKFVLPGGEVNLIIFAFSTISVIQNDTSGGQLLVTMNNEDTRDDIKQVVDNIYFRANAIGNDYFSRSGSPYDRARGYNPSLLGETGWHYTNYDDALLDIARIASTSFFNNPAAGRHIDLALFLTDGKPNFHNGPSRVFDPANTPQSFGNPYINQGVNYASQTVSALRNGSTVAGLPSRPPMAVRGVLIEADAANYMEQVFGAGSDNFLFASNFGTELNKQLDKIVNSLSEGICALEVVSPSIEVSVNPGNITLTETQNRSYTITVRNTSPVPVTNLVVTINGVYFTTIPNLGPQGATDGIVTRTNILTLPLGGNLPSQLNIEVRGTATPTSTQRFADNSSSKIVTGGDTIGVSITRLALPA